MNNSSGYPRGGDRDRGGRPKQSATNYGLWLLRYGPKSAWTMGRKLEMKGYEAEEAAQAVADLCAWGYIDDDAYARNLIRQRKTSNVKGKAWVLRTLRQEGVEPPEDFDGLYTDEEELQLAQSLVRRVSGGQVTPENRPKCYRALQSRGFSQKAAFKALASLGDDVSDGDDW